jgi:hypothetical protein
LIKGSDSRTTRLLSNLNIRIACSINGATSRYHPAAQTGNGDQDFALRLVG